MTVKYSSEKGYAFNSFICIFVYMERGRYIQRDRDYSFDWDWDYTLSLKIVDSIAVDSNPFERVKQPLYH